jgi:hypothetical protein
MKIANKTLEFAVKPSSPIPRVSLRVVDLMEKDMVKELRPPLSIKDQ